MSNDLVTVPFSSAEFAENPEMRCPCLLLLDVSESMNDGDQITELNNGLVLLKDELMKDEMAVKRVEIALVVYGGDVKVLSGFVPVDQFYPPRLRASGGTPMGEAIITGTELLRERKDLLRSNVVPYFRPWIWLMTDGRPTDEANIPKAAEIVRQGEEQQGFMFFACGVEGADMNALGRIAVRKPLRMRDMHYAEMFRWLSSSMKSTSRSRPGAKASVTNPVAPDGWADVG
jgi:uncharacterized protein YegL